MWRHEARRRFPSRRTRAGPTVEPLEGRCVLTAPPAPSNPADILNGLPAKEGHDLDTLYRAFLQGVAPNQYSTLFPTLTITGTSVKVDVNGQGDFSGFLGTLRNLGMNITASSAKYELAEGDVAISQLAILGAIPQVLDVSPVYKPTLNSPSVSALGRTASTIVPATVTSISHANMISTSAPLTHAVSAIGVPGMGRALMQKLHSVPLYHASRGWA